MQYILEDLDNFQESFPLFNKIKDIQQKYKNYKSMPQSYCVKDMKDLFYSTIQHYEMNFPKENYIRYSYQCPDAYIQKRMKENPTEIYEYNMDPFYYNHRQCQFIVAELKNIEFWYEEVLLKESFHTKVHAVKDFWIPHLITNSFEMTPKMYDGVNSSFGELLGPSIAKYIEEESRKQKSSVKDELAMALDKVHALEEENRKLKEALSVRGEEHRS